MSGSKWYGVRSERVMKSGLVKRRGGESLSQDEIRLRQLVWMVLQLNFSRKEGNMVPVLFIY